MDEKEKGYGGDYGATLTVIGAPDKGNVPHFLLHVRLNSSISNIGCCLYLLN